MYVRDLSIGDVVEIAGDHRVLGQYVGRTLSADEVAEARRCGFYIGYVRHFRGYKSKETMIYLGPMRTKTRVAGLFKHHLFLTPHGTFGIEGYDFRFLKRVED